MSRKSAPKFRKISRSCMGEILCGINTIRLPVLMVLGYRSSDDLNTISKVEELSRMILRIWTHEL